MVDDFAAWVAPIDADEPGIEADRSALDLARCAADLVLQDLHRTTDARPVIEVRHDVEYGLIVSYNGGYSTPAMGSLQNPEATAEVAAYLQGEITGDVWSVWPTCPIHGSGLDAVAADGSAIWACRADGHRVAVIGQLAR